MDREDYNRWIRTAREKGAKYIISVCDTFDWEDYPVYCKDDTELTEKRSQYDNVNMQKINEVIDVENANFL